MKKNYSLLFFAFALTALTACNTHNDYHEGGFHSQDNSPIIQENDAILSYWYGFQMRIDPGSVTPTGLRLVMVNNADFYFGHGVMFNIEQYMNGAWTQVPFTTDSIGWILPLLMVHPNTTSEENIGWSHMHGELPPGQYRLVRNFMNMGDDMWSWQSTDDAYLFALFTVEEAWQDAYKEWQTEQDGIRARAYARFEGLDLAITDFGLTGLSFTLTNNNPEYNYIIHSAFVGWSDTFPEGGHAAAIEYFIFSPSHPSPSWPFEAEVNLQKGESISAQVSWYAEIGNIYPARRPNSPNPTVFELVVDVLLDADEMYIDNINRHIVPGVPGSEFRLSVEFDVSEI